MLELVCRAKVKNQNGDFPLPDGAAQLFPEPKANWHRSTESDLQYIFFSIPGDEVMEPAAAGFLTHTVYQLRIYMQVGEENQSEQDQWLDGWMDGVTVAVSPAASKG